MTKKDMASYIKYLRKKHNYTQQQLSNKLKIGRSTLVRIENEGNPTFETLLKVVEIFNEEIYICPKNTYHDKLVHEIGNKIYDTIINNQPQPIRHVRYGWVYIINLKNKTEIIKVGMTREDEPINRLKSINDTPLGSHEIEIHYVRLTSDCRKIESDMHKSLEKYRIYDEWFKINRDIAKNILDKTIDNLETQFLHDQKAQSCLNQRVAG